MFPETAQKTLEEVEETFLEGIPARKTRRGTKLGHKVQRNREELEAGRNPLFAGKATADGSSDTSPVSDVEPKL